MILSPDAKKWIDNASLHELLKRWRFAPTGDPLFQGETGEYYKMVMFRKRDEDVDEFARISKRIGW